MLKLYIWTLKTETLQDITKHSALLHPSPCPHKIFRNQRTTNNCFLLAVFTNPKLLPACGYWLFLLLLISVFVSNSDKGNPAREEGEWHRTSLQVKKIWILPCETQTKDSCLGNLQCRSRQQPHLFSSYFLLSIFVTASVTEAPWREFASRLLLLFPTVRHSDNRASGSCTVHMPLASVLVGWQ